MKNIILSILIIVIISVFISGNKVEDIEDKNIIIPQNSRNNKLLLFFPQKEIDIIEKAAKRNNCSGENLIILFSIRKAENGGKNFEFGIKNSRANDFDSQAGWCAATIIKNRERWERAGKPSDFISFLGNRYCPSSGSNLSTKEKELNKNWIPNVKYWVKKLSD